MPELNDEEGLSSQQAVLMGDACDPPSRLARLGEHMRDQVDDDYCLLPLVAFCFVTGYLDAISSSTFSIWCGFQTGNFTTLAMFVTGLFSRHGSSFYSEQKTLYALCALAFFNLGAFCARLGDRPTFNCKSRSWLFSCSLIQTMLCGMATMVMALGKTQYSQLYAIACLSASLGLQGVNAKRLDSQLSTTVVLTALWCDLMTDPKLFALPFRQNAVLRDQKLLALVSLFIGAMFGRALVENRGVAGALGVGTGLRMVIAMSWLLVPAKKGVFLS